MAFKRPSVQFCPAPPDCLKTPDHHKDGRGFLAFGKFMKICSHFFLAASGSNGIAKALFLWQCNKNFWLLSI